MYSHLLSENENKRLDIPLRSLFCFVMFCVWQMGIIYYVGPALNIDGRTPLPIAADNLTVLIVIGYICSILCMVLFPKKIIILARATSLVALVSALGLFLPFEKDILTVLIYLQCFCCCYMIGFESATMVHYFTKESVTKHLLIAYPIGYTLIAFIQNDFFSFDFSVFRILIAVMLVLLVMFYFKIPVSAGINFVKKSDGLVLPKRFFGGIMLLSFLSALLGVIAPAAAAEVKHGVFAAYIGCAAGSLMLYLIYKKTGKHPICFVAYVIGLSAIGYVLMVISHYVPFWGIPACTLMGFGMAACALIPMFAMLLVKQYPSKFVVPSCIGLAMGAVIVQSVLVELFRSSMVLLNIAYLAVVITLVIIYQIFEPFLIYSMERKFEEHPLDKKNGDTVEVLPQESSVLALLTKREAEVVELIGYGHSNRDIADILYISEHTVKDHTKNIYRKLNVHSRFELTALVNAEKSGAGKLCENCDK